jgi:hypothetical protein
LVQPQQRPTPPPALTRKTRKIFISNLRNFQRLIFTQKPKIIFF